MKKEKIEVCAIIPARGGSKGLPGKNIKPLAGKPLIAYSIEAAKGCRYVNRIIVSTDSQQIADTAVQYGAEIPFLRPPELATDDASTESVLKNTIESLEKGGDYKIDIILFLQPTDIFRRKSMIDQVVESLIINPDVDSAFVAYRDHKNYWKSEGGKYLRMDNRGYIPRQKKESIFREDTGIALATRTKVIRAGRRIGDNVVIIPNDDVASFVDIHDEFSFWLAEKIITDKKYPVNL